MTEFGVAMLVLIGTGVTGLVTWLVARRSTSGRVDTTEAATLWQESQAIRKELRDEATSLRALVAALHKEVIECHGESASLKARLAALEKKDSEQA